MSRGKYIVFEGGEGVGKSTQAKRVAEAAGALSVYEPGSTELGQGVRALLLNPNISTQPTTEALLFAAQRAELIETVVEPALEAGRHVVSDRSWISSAAYQVARGLTLETITEMNRLAIGQKYMRPDILLFLDADPVEVRNRWSAETDYFEQMDMSFHSEVRANFRSLCGRLGGVTIDAAQSIEQVSSEIDSYLHQHNI